MVQGIEIDDRGVNKSYHELCHLIVYERKLTLKYQ